MRRRALLTTGAGTAAVLLTGCAAEDGRPGGDGTHATDAETELRRRSATTSRELLSRYDAVIARHTALTARLAPLRAEVDAHVTALSPAGTAASSSPAAAATAADPKGTPRPSGTSDPNTTARRNVPADPAVALRELAAAERRTADAHAATLGGAPDEFARLLASVAAAAAAHAYLLTEGNRA
ncbi:hypothetical protein GCM10020367_47550 [Streptomyces sannanensis]|uniref:Lipoprotein n=1 Tax=Streptomyces sannanensis TaxID=285536 RepID=A0ABP6SH81_9ACTN